MKKGINTLFLLVKKGRFVPLLLVKMATNNWG